MKFEKQKSHKAALGHAFEYAFTQAASIFLATTAQHNDH